MTVSVVLPTYNEVRVVDACLKSLYGQTKKQELILVDDGSTDNTWQKIKNYESRINGLRLLQQKHKGPGAARNLGAKNACGDILVFVDADMTFAKNFIEDLVKPIEIGKTKGTFTKKEYVSNWDNVWARCWNYNLGITDKLRIPNNYPDTAPVFRAILASEFRKVNGFNESVGWTDDWSLARKLGYKATATYAVCYHRNPDSLKEVFTQARWIGKNEFISGTSLRMFLNGFRYSFLTSMLAGFYKSLLHLTPQFLIFKFVYNTAISLSLLEMLFGTEKNK